ncbi:MAG: bacillithiol biosynthesis cysteine-adding enzyme BshC [Patiriisocius sp.]|jgi:bacillithiol biosynthesis cysteine-adding enzyme BshC
MIKVDEVAYENSEYANKLMADYYGGEERLKKFYSHSPNLEGILEAASKRMFSNDTRKVLCNVLKDQHEGFDLHDSQKRNLELLGLENTLTVTTGHQLGLFTGPLYTIYKIVSTIKLARQLNQSSGENKFVPIYWLASEDHDIDEIDHMHIFGKTVKWHHPKGDAVGRMKLDCIEGPLEEVYEILGDSNNALEIKEMLSKAYSSDKNLTQATRAVIHHLFSRHGLIIFDADNRSVKGEFKSIFKKEILDDVYSQKVNQLGDELLDLGYKKQVNPREINIFYLDDGERNRIKRVEGKFIIDSSEKTVSGDELLEILDKTPERFSPNVILRPLLQECILPNVAYVGGPGELTYWLELKDGFDYYELPFPGLILRNSALIVDQQSQKKLLKLNMSAAELFGELESLLKSRITKDASIDTSLDYSKSHLMTLYDGIMEKVGAVDQSLMKFAQAERKKTENSINVIEKKLVQAEKRKQDVTLNQIRSLKEKLFPGNGMQERKDNFFQYYLSDGYGIIESLMESFDPISNSVNVYSLQGNKA